jgi:hypothetical protein
VSVRWAVVSGFTVLCVLTALLLPAMPQTIEYHAFADTRSWLGIANFGNVVSNAAFFAVGAAGLAATFGSRARFAAPSERWPYAVFFAGILLTAFGSAYYHLAPDNERLFWDRLPMTIAFMGFVSSQLVDRVSVKAGLALLAPLLVVGAASVIYWRVSERAGAGNVIPYLALQAYSVFLMLLLAYAMPSRYTRGADLYWVFAWYALSKLLETADAFIFGLGGFVSGHTLKHLAAAVSGIVVIRMLMRRSLVAQPATPDAASRRADLTEGTRATAAARRS